MVTKTLSSHALAAKEIRKVLKENFPKTIFRVRSNSYSGGDSVYVNWIDGPTYDQVDTLVRDYQKGHFDGMNDIYEYSNEKQNIPQVKYVLPERKLSDESRQNMENELAEKFCIINKGDEKEWYNKFYDWKDRVISRYLSDKVLE